MIDFAEFTLEDEDDTKILIRINDIVRVYDFGSSSGILTRTRLDHRSNLVRVKEGYGTIKKGLGFIVLPRAETIAKI